MGGKNKGVIALVLKAVENECGLKESDLHCIIHQHIWAESPIIPQIY